MAATRIVRDERGLLVEYTPDFGFDWLRDRLEADGEFTLRRSLTFVEGDVVEWPDDTEEMLIRLGSVEGGYWHVPGRVFGEGCHDVYIGIECRPEMRWFVVRDVSVFRHVFEVVNEVVCIGGDRPGSMPEAEFRALADSFPWSAAETRLYAWSRIQSAVESYFSTREDFQTRYQDHMELAAARRSASSAFPEEPGFGLGFDVARAALYGDALTRLEAVVYGNARELDFQRILPPYLELLFPQYIAFVPQAVIPDGKGRMRRPDFLLVDARGNVDVLEIKRPFDNRVMLAGGLYRDNCIPARELSGAVMQCRKYVSYLNGGGAALEARLAERLVSAGFIPDGMGLSFASSKGLVIMGRDPERGRLGDFDIIRRQYAGMVDVITYDDLIRRFRRIVGAIERKTSGGHPGSPASD